MTETVSLLTDLGGDSEFGENTLIANDDGSTAEIDITPIFEDGLNFFGRDFTSLWINNNGSVTFNGARSTFTPDVIIENNNNPEITPFFADVDTRGGATEISAGGTSTGSNLVYYDLDEENDRIVITWDDVGYYNSETDLTNAFQLVLTDRDDGDFDIQFRYENIEWTTGNASGGEDGLGGIVARAGFTASTGDPDAYFELPASGDQESILALDETEGNTGEIGIWEFSVRSGNINSSEIPDLPDLTVWGTTSGDPHLVTLDGVAYDFHAAGEFVLLRSTDDSDFEIQSRMSPVDGAENLTVNAAIALRFGGSNVMLDSTDESVFSVDGVATEIANFGSLTIGDDVVFRSNNVYIFAFSGEDGTVSDGDSHITVTVEDDRVDFAAYLNDSLLGSLEGLLGNGDGDTENDIAYADGTIVERPLAYEDLYGAYRDDWRVNDVSNSLFTYDADESLEGFYLSDYPAEIASLDDYSAEEVEAATVTLVEFGLTEGTVAFNNALIDYLATGDESYIDAAANTAVLSSDTQLEISTEEELGRTNNEPTSIALSSMWIDENSAASSVVGVVTVEDEDIDDTHTLELLGDADGRFTLDGDTLVVAEGAELDHETSSNHDISLIATDAGGLSVEQEFTITVNNVAEAPSSVTSTTLAIAENSAAALAVGILAVTDPDIGDDHTFELLDDAEGRFTVDGDTLVVAEGADLDHEANASHEVIVQATDLSGLTAEEAITIAITNVTETFEGTDGNDTIETGVGGDLINLGGGADRINGLLEDFFDDNVTGFGSDDTLLITDATVSRDAITVTEGSAILGIDLEGDGSENGSITLDGDFSAGDFMAVVLGSQTYVTFETFLPELTDREAVDASLINGINNQIFLTGDGSSDFQVSLRDMGAAGYQNVLGVYEIDASGNIVDTRILFENVNADRSAVTGITDVEDGNQLGFFLVQDAADWAGGLSDTDGLSFVNSSGEAADISDGSDLSIAVNGIATDEMVFHSFSADMNSDGVEHALSGVDAGGQSISVGFEDLTGGGDEDYEDVVFRVEVVDEFMLT